MKMMGAIILTFLGMITMPDGPWYREVLAALFLMLAGRANSREP